MYPYRFNHLGSNKWKQFHNYRIQPKRTPAGARIPSKMLVDFTRPASRSSRFSSQLFSLAMINTSKIMLSLYSNQPKKGVQIIKYCPYCFRLVNSDGQFLPSNILSFHIREGCFNMELTGCFLQKDNKTQHTSIYVIQVKQSRFQREPFIILII